MSELFARLQRALPQHAISRFAGRVASARPGWVRRPLIEAFTRVYGVDLSEAEHSDPAAYPDFNAFFSRALRPGARPVDGAPDSLVSPADGTISQVGQLDDDRLLQAKGTSYRLGSLLDSHRLAENGGAIPGAEEFRGGSFMTVYLAPRDYHRVHAPVAGTVTATTAIPGSLFSVNALTEAAVSDLFCRNERLVCRLQTRHGAMLVVLIGAMIVASIDTAWPDARSPYRRLEHRHQHVGLAKGEEMGRFLLGSTVIVCCEPGRLVWEAAAARGARVRMGQRLGRFVD